MCLSLGITKKKKIMGTAQYKVKNPKMIAPPYNSILTWIETGLWQLFCAIVGMVVLIDAWDTNSGLLLALLLFGFALNAVFYLWTIFWDGYRVKPLSEIRAGKGSDMHIMYWVLWLGDQPHFFINSIMYIFVIIFFGIWVGTQNGLVAYQPLPLVPTSSDITNLVIHKFFAFIIVLIAAANWVFLWRTERFAQYEILKDMKKNSGEITESSTYSKKSYH